MICRMFIVNLYPGLFQVISRYTRIRLGVSDRFFLIQLSSIRFLRFLAGRLVLFVSSFLDYIGTLPGTAACMRTCLSVI